MSQHGCVIVTCWVAGCSQVDANTRAARDVIEGLRCELNNAEGDRRHQRKVVETRQNKLTKFELQLDAKKSAVLEERNQLEQ